MPPATTISDSPSVTACAASPTAFSPEPHTLLMVIAATRGSSPPPQRRLPRRILPQPRLHHVAHDHFVHLLRLNARAPHRFRHHFRAELRRAKRRKPAHEFPDRRAHGAQDHGLFHDGFSFVVKILLCVRIFAVEFRSRQPSKRAQQAAPLP